MSKFAGVVVGILVAIVIVVASQFVENKVTKEEVDTSLGACSGGTFFFWRSVDVSEVSLQEVMTVGELEGKFEMFYKSSCHETIDIHAKKLVTKQLATPVKAEGTLNVFRLNGGAAFIVKYKHIAADKPEMQFLDYVFLDSVE